MEQWGGLWFTIIGFRSAETGSRYDKNHGIAWRPSSTVNDVLDNKSDVWSLIFLVGRCPRSNIIPGDNTENQRPVRNIVCTSRKCRSIIGIFSGDFKGCHTGMGFISFKLNIGICYCCALRNCYICEADADFLIASSGIINQFQIGTCQEHSPIFSFFSVISTAANTNFNFKSLVWSCCLNRIAFIWVVTWGIISFHSETICGHSSETGIDE